MGSVSPTLPITPLNYLLLLTPPSLPLHNPPQPPITSSITLLQITPSPSPHAPYTLNTLNTPYTAYTPYTHSLPSNNNVLFFSEKTLLEFKSRIYWEIDRNTREIVNRSFILGHPLCDITMHGRSTIGWSR